MAFDVNAIFAESMNNSYRVQQSIGDSGALQLTGEKLTFGPAPIDFAAPAITPLPHVVIASVSWASVSGADGIASASSTVSNVCIFLRSEVTPSCALALSTASSSIRTDCAGRHTAESSISGLTIFGNQVGVTGAPNQHFTSTTQYGRATGTINYRSFDALTNTGRAAGLVATFNFPTGFQVINGTIVVASSTSSCAS